MATIDINKSFEFGVRPISVWKDDSTNKHYVNAVASDTEEDYHGERLSLNALNGLVKCINNKEPYAVTLLPSHWDAFEIGVCESSKVIDSQDVSGAKALSVDIELDLDYPEARSLYNDVKKGKSKKQLSIGGYLNPDNENAYYWEPKMKYDDNGNLVQDWVLVLDDVILEHIAVTRANKAANNRSGFVGTIAKSLGLEKPKDFIIKEQGFNVLNDTKNKFWEVKNSAKNKGEIFIYGDIVSYKWWDEDVSANSLIKDVKDLGDISELDIRINSGGGSVFAAAAILSYLRSHKAFKTVYIDGLAASAASVIAMAGDKICMPSHAMMMIHNPATIAWGDSREMRKTADTLDKIRDSIVNAYQTKCGKDYETICNLMDEETWMTGKEAVEQGFADVVLDNVEISAYYEKDILNVNGLSIESSRFKNKSKITEIMKSIEKEGGISMAKNGVNKGMANGWGKAVNNFLNPANNENEKAKAEEAAKIENARKALEVLNSLNGLDNLPEDLKAAINSLNTAPAANTDEVDPVNSGSEDPVVDPENTEGSEEPVTEDNPTDNPENTEGSEGPETNPATEPENFNPESFKDSIMDEVKNLINGIQEENKKSMESVGASVGKIIGEVVKQQLEPLNSKISAIEKSAGGSKSLSGQEKPAVTKQKTTTEDTVDESNMWDGFIKNALPTDFKNKYNETEEQ
ncbi:MAG: hypothetical protein K0Q47_12 [Sedimentibacter sp.]|nr:hypothetical protein [Sedimentibacter sp.]